MRSKVKRGLLCCLLFVLMATPFTGCSNSDAENMKQAKDMCNSFTQLIYNIPNRTDLPNNMSRAKLLCSSGVYNKRCNLSDGKVLDKYFIAYGNTKYVSTIASNIAEKVNDKEYKVTVVVEIRHFVNGNKQGDKCNLAINYVVKDGKIATMQEFDGFNLLLQ